VAGGRGNDFSSRHKNDLVGNGEDGGMVRGDEEGAALRSESLKEREDYALGVGIK
jgi:hypothetical protein